jgi:hypothetical protein
VDWVIKAANEHNAERHRRQKVEDEAPKIWQEVTKVIEASIGTYRQLPGASEIRLNGSGSNKLVITAFDQPYNKDRESVTIRFDPQRPQITVRLSRDKNSDPAYPIGVDVKGERVSLGTISPTASAAQALTERALKSLFFPKP